MVEAPALITDCDRCFHKACCVIFVVPLKAHEVDKYDVERVEGFDGPNFYLRRTGVGECVYMAPGGGCMIHGRAPIACRSWSCTKDNRWPHLIEPYLSGKDRQTK